MQGPSITVENLSLKLGSSLIVSPMTFSIPAGRVHCFIGPNGGGKTSTLRCLLGQMPHDGTISIKWGDQQTIGYVPQLIELDKTLPLTLEDFLTIVSQDKPAFTGTKKDIQPLIESALEKTELLDKRKFMLGSLSGGERQRLLFAQALIPEPALLILDEPMTSMDENGIRMVEKLIQDYCSNGTTVLWVNHDLKQVERIADSISVIDKGLVAHGECSTTLTKAMKHGNYSPVTEASEA